MNTNIFLILKKHFDTMFIAITGFFASIGIAQINLYLQCLLLVVTIALMLYREFFKKTKS